MGTGRHHSPEARARIAEGTRRAMAAPEVRERIRSGMQRSGWALPGGLYRLTDAWKRATPEARREFLNQLADGSLNPDQLPKIGATE